MVEEVLQFLADWLVAQAAAGNQACRNMVVDGHLAAWRCALQDLRRQRHLVEGNLKRQ